MKPRLPAFATLLLALTQPLQAHRLDEYLQATILSVDRNLVHASIRLVPGIAIAPAVIFAIDTDRDGLFSPAEQRAYATLVLAGLTIEADGQTLHPALLSASFPKPTQILQGLGEIHLELAAPLPAPTKLQRTLTLSNRYRNTGSAYLVNALVPTDPTIEILTQTRNENQSLYRLEYTQSTLQPSGPHRALEYLALASTIFLVAWLTRRLYVRETQRRTRGMAAMMKPEGHTTC